MQGRRLQGGDELPPLLRGIRNRRVQCVRADTYKRPRYFHRRELARVIASLKI